MEHAEKKQKIHYAWKILLACCLINMSALGLTNSNGLFYPVICEELGLSLSVLNIHTVFMGIASAVTLLFVDKVYKRFNAKTIIVASLILYHLSYMIMGSFHNVVEFCIGGTLAGVAGAFLLYVPVPMLINNWFVKKKKIALSLCFVASGLSGILTSLLLGVTITNLGWRWSFVIRGGLLLLITVPVLFIIKKNPEDLGLRPYGEGEAEDEKKSQTRFDGTAEKDSKASLRVRFIAAVALAVMLNLSCGMTYQLPNFATQSGLGIMMGSVLTSLAMVGNISSKAAFGPLTEWKGVRFSGCLVAGLVLAGFLTLGLGANSFGIIAVASVTTGMSACVNTLVIPNLLSTFATGDDYVHMLSICSSGTMVASSVCVVVSSLLFDCFGDYRPVFLCYAGLMAVIITVILVFFGKKKRFAGEKGKEA